MEKKYKIAFFGGEPLGLPALEALCEAGLTPQLVVCNPDRPSGRGQQLHPPRIKVWAEEHNLPVHQPESFKDKEALSLLTDSEWDLFVVVAYNFILPKWFLYLPKHGVLNMHPSLLPKLRGASPIRTAILEDRRDDIGISIMLMDEKMDHGPILAQEPVMISYTDWPMNGSELDTLLAKHGGNLLAATIPAWLSGSITPIEQDHAAATYTKRFEKSDAELTIDPHHLPVAAEAYQLLRTIRAFAGTTDCYFIHNGKRVKIKAAALSEGGQLLLLRVTPEGKSEMDFLDYLRFHL